MVGDYVEVSGIVTAVGTTKDAYSAAYYYIQMTDGTAEYAGIEVFKEDHTHLKGDTVTIKGVVRESFGVTEIVECFGTKTGTGTMPTPITVTTDDFQGCSLTAEKYEGMLVQTGEVTVQPCENQLTTDLIAAGSKGGYYCQANLENLEWPECFDKYKQMWVKSTGATGKVSLEDSKRTPRPSQKRPAKPCPLLATVASCPCLPRAPNQPTTTRRAQPTCAQPAHLIACPLLPHSRSRWRSTTTRSSSRSSTSAPPAPPRLRPGRA